jgi:hypothetical protein
MHPDRVWTAGGRSSVGRASPLQGEGQEFESPRLHHPSTTRHGSSEDETTGSLSQGSIEDRVDPGDPQARTAAVHDGSRSTSGRLRVSAPGDPLVRVLELCLEVTDQRIAGMPDTGPAGPQGPRTFTSEDTIGRSSSIKNFDFCRRTNKVMIPDQTSALADG